MKLRVGIIGLGNHWESRYRPALRSLSDRFEVRAVCAEVAMRAEQAAREFDAVPVDGFRAMLNREDVDAMLLLATDWIDSLPILAACDAGKAVYSAAELQVDPQQIRGIKQRVESSGIAFMAEMSRRHAPATLRLKELIATRLGPPSLLFCHARTEPRQQKNDLQRSRGDRASSVPELMQLVDWCRYVAEKEPTSVTGVRHQAVGDNSTDDYEMMSLDFSPEDSPGTGTMAQISCGHYLPSRWPEAISFRSPAAMQVCCESGIAFVDLPSKVIWFDEAGQHLESLDSERPVGEQLLMHFHRAVTSLVRKTSDLEDAYRALNIVLAANESCQQGRRIALEF